MTVQIPTDFQWFEPWEPVLDGDFLVAELLKELSPSHVLFGCHAKAIARRCDCDDVLFAIDHSAALLAVIHLTWTGGQESDPTWPNARLFRDWQDWAENCLAPDHIEYGKL